MTKFAGGKAGATLLILSAVISLWIALCGGFVFFGDATRFFAYADKLALFRTDHLYLYTPGYPFLILISGFPFTGSIIPLLAIQAVFAALTPWLAFKTFASFNRKAGFAAGTICLASLTPFFFENTFFHDGPSLFFGFLSSALASSFFATKRSRYLYLSLFSATFAYFTHPGVIGFLVGYAGTFVLFALRERRQFKHLVVALVLIFVWISGFSAFQKWTWQKDGNPAVSASQIGRRLLFGIYLESTPYGGFDVAGAAGNNLRQELVRFFSDSPEEHDYRAALRNQHADAYQVLFGQYKGRATELVDQIFARPNRYYYEELQGVPDEKFGVPDRVLLRAAAAYIYQHPLIALNYTLEHLIDMAIGPPWSCGGQELFPRCRMFQRPLFYPALADQMTLAPGMMPNGTLAPGAMQDNSYQFLRSRTVAPTVRAAAGAWQWIYSNLRSVLIAAMLIGWLSSFWGLRELRWPLSAFVTAYAANMLVFSLFEFPEFRYQMVSIAMSAFSAGAGICAIARATRRAFRSMLRSADLKEIDEPLR